MRIVGGEFRGRRLAPVRGRDVRPTSDMVREAIFNLLGPIDGYSVLDLFAGTGALGLEALSRGALQATFVEIDKSAAEIVRRNIDATVSGSAHKTDLIKGDAVRVVQTLAMAGEHYDIVFFDPPYERTEALLAATADILPGVCSDGARIVIELSTRHAPLVAQAASSWGCEVLRERKYGDTTVALLQLGESTPGEVPIDPDEQPDEDEDDD